MKNVLNLYLVFNSTTDNYNLFTNGIQNYTMIINKHIMPYIDIEKFFNSLAERFQNELFKPQVKAAVPDLAFHTSTKVGYENWMSLRQLNPDLPVEIVLQGFDAEYKPIPYTYVPRAKKYDIEIPHSGAINIIVQDVVTELQVDINDPMDSIIANINSILYQFNPALRLSVKDTVKINSFKFYTDLFCSDVVKDYQSLFANDFKKSLDFKMQTLLKSRRSLKPEDKAKAETEITNLNFINKIYGKYQDVYLNI